MARPDLSVAFSVLVFMLLSPAAALRADSLRITSPDFAQGAAIPSKYGKAHANISPALQIKGAPAKTQSFALIVDDPDAPGGLFTHWLIWNIPAHGILIREGKVPRGAEQGKNSDGHDRYDGPIPPSGMHRYFFHLFAVDQELRLAPGASRKVLESALRGHVLAKAETFGTFQAGK